MGEEGKNPRLLSQVVDARDLHCEKIKLLDILEREYGHFKGKPCVEKVMRTLGKVKGRGRVGGSHRKHIQSKEGQ